MRGTAAFAAALLLAGVAPAGADLAEVRSCVETNSPRLSSVLTISLRVQEDAGESSESRLKLYWRRLPDGVTRVLLRFQAPQDLARAALLAEAAPEGRPRAHVYLPEIGKPQQVTSRAQVEGFLGRSELGIEEVGLLLDPLGSAQLRLLPEISELGGRRAWGVERAEPQRDDARYSRVVLFVDQQYCLPLRAEFYGGGEQPRKLLRVDPAHVTREGKSWVPRLLVFENLESGSLATLRIESAEIDIPLAPGLLTVQALAAGG